MSDLVERLRGANKHPFGVKSWRDLVREAADEIERLREALQDLIDRWPDERGYDGAIQRARALLMETALRSPKDEDVAAAIREGKDEI